jgi:uncharacterized protein (DUF362 family)
MFFQCPKCKRVWQYPIERCPDCFSDLERIKSEKIKVIGISKVTIPTIFHQKTPYFVLVLEDEKGNKWAQKSIKEYKIGDLFKVEPCTNKNAVAIWRIKYDILEGIEKVIELIGGLDINQNSKILVLPTLNAPVHPHFAENTSPEFLEATIEFLLKKGAKLLNIRVAAQSFDEIPIEASAQKSQLLNVCLQNQITPLDLAKTNFVKKTQNGLTFEISEEVFNSDLIINLPILKLDSKLGVRGATENTLKFLKKENYLGLKYLYSEEEIIENLQEVLLARRSLGEGGPNFLTIADGQTIQKADGFTALLGLVLASFNSLNLDRVFAEITMIKGLPEYLKKIKIEDIPIVGRRVEELQYEVEKT